jgi:hypothetical protein
LSIARQCFYAVDALFDLSTLFFLIFSSPELKAQVSFSDRFLSVVRLFVICRLASVVCL